MTAEHRRSVDDNETFWAEAALELTWTRPWERVLEFDGVNHRWFRGRRDEHHPERL
jgi:hypothetical protein